MTRFKERVLDWRDKKLTFLWMWLFKIANKRTQKKAIEGFQCLGKAMNKDISIKINEELIN